eukprot:scaffold8115_cov104-Isochrysis_galbana.AAC.3
MQDATEADAPMLGHLMVTAAKVSPRAPPPSGGEFCFWTEQRMQPLDQEAQRYCRRRDQPACWAVFWLGCTPEPRPPPHASFRPLSFSV